MLIEKYNWFDLTDYFYKNPLLKSKFIGHNILADYLNIY